MRLIRVSLAPVVLFYFAGTLCKGSESPYDLLKKAQYFADLYNWRVASPLFQRAEPLLRSSGDRSNALYAHIGVLRLASNAPLEARSEELAHLLNTDQLLQSERQLRLFALTVKGDIDGEIDQSAAREDWTEVSRLAEELGNAKWVYRAEGQLGFADYYDGDLTSCQRKVSSALIAATSARDVGAQIFFLSTIAHGYQTQGLLLPLAVEYANKAIALAEAHPDAGPPMIANAALIRALAGMGNVSEAKQLSQRLLANPKLDYAERVNYLRSAGDVAVAEKNNREAISYFNQAISVATACGGLREAADLQSSVSNLYLQGGDVLKAERLARSAIATLERSGATPLLPAKFDSLAQVLIAQRRYSEANTVYERAETLQDTLIGRADSLLVKTALVTGADQLYAHHFALLADHFNDPGAAYDVVEQGRGRAVVDLLLSQASTSPGAVATERRIAKLRLQMGSTNSADEISRLREAIFLAEQARAVNPDLTILGTKRFRPVLVQRVQNSLNSSEMLLEYVVAEPASYVLVLTPASRQIIRLAGRKTIEKRVAEYTRSVKQGLNARQQARDLYIALLQPIVRVESKSHYIVIPDGCLNLLPFDALIDQHERYVVQSHVVSYAPSSTTLFLLRSKDWVAKRPEALLAVGGVPYSNSGIKGKLIGPPNALDRKFEDLPNSELEAKIAATAFKNSENEELTGTAATEANLKQALSEGFGYVHLAVHAVSSDNPDRASLVVLSDPSRGEDGFVQASEIVQMRLGARMVILSACETDVGPIEGEEGLSALSTSFLLAGVRTVVSTLWPVEDQSSLALMKAFYEHLGSGQSVADSLAAAKRDMLSKYGVNSLPIYWAGFVVQGSEPKKTLQLR